MSQLALCKIFRHPFFAFEKIFLYPLKKSNCRTNFDCVKFSDTYIYTLKNFVTSGKNCRSTTTSILRFSNLRINRINVFKDNMISVRREP